MAINKRILLLTCPIFIVIIICLASVAYSSFYSIPELQTNVQKGHIRQQLLSKSRDLQFLEYSLQAGYQEIYKQLFTLRSFYNQILLGNVSAGSSASPSEVKLTDMIDGTLELNDPITFNKINNRDLQQLLEVSGWFSTDTTKTHDQVMASAALKYPNVERDHQLIQTMMKGILSPYYLNAAENVMTSNSGIQDNIYSVGITFPELGMALFMPIPTKEMIESSPTDTPSLASGKLESCSTILSSVYNFKNVCATGEKPTLYIVQDSNQQFSRVGGISQRFQVAANVNAMIYAQFELSSKQSSLINSLVNHNFGQLFITFNDDNLTLIGFDKLSDQQTMQKTLLNQIYGDDLSSNEAANFTSEYNNARETLQNQIDTSSSSTGSISPVQFEYTVKTAVYYCLLIPIKVNPGILDSNGDLSIEETETIFYLGFIAAEKDMISEFRDTNDRLKYIELVSFIVISAICLLSGCIVVRYSYMISFSYENPIITMSELMSQIDPDYVDQEDQYEQYQSYFTSDEIKSLFEAMVTLLKNFKYSNQKFHDDDALTLLELSRAKQFYMKLGNQNGVGICCNNIGNIHLKNTRYLEAISEYQEAILMGTIENEHTLEEINKEQRNESEKRSLNQQTVSGVTQYQPGVLDPSNAAAAAGAAPMYSPGNQKQQNRGNSKRRTFVNNVNGSMKKAAAKQIGGGNNNPSMQSSTMKNFNRATKDGTLSRQSHFQNDDDYEFNIDDADIENSHTNRNHNNLPNQLASSPNQFNEGTNLISSHERKLKDLLLKLDISRTRLLNRKYQLGVALFEYSTMQKDDLFHEAIRVFDKCIALSDQEGFTPTIIIRKIMILNKKAYSHTCLGEYDNAESAIAEAREMLTRLKTANFDDNCEESPYLFLNIFCAIPVEVLTSKIDLQEAILELARFNFKKSALIFTRILEEGETYDSQIRKYAIVSLKNILEMFSLSIPGLEPKLMKFNLRTIEIIMLVDYSKDMNADQIKTSHLRCKSIFDKINSKDKIGFVQFNDSVHENFPLQEKQLYNELLEKKIRSIPMSSGGRSNLFKALVVTAGLFEKSEREQKSVTRFEETIDRRDVPMSRMYIQETNPIESQTFMGLQSAADATKKNLGSGENAERLRFIFLFTEGSNNIKEQDLQILREKMSRNNVHLIVINICQQNANMLYLRFLVQSISEKSQFFQSNDNEAELYLQSQREQLSTFQFISEYF